MTNESSKNCNLDIAAYRILYDNIYDFKNTASAVESKIRELKIDQSKGDQIVPDTNGRKHHDMWVSMKTVSHFNLGISLELMLKFLLHLNIRSSKAHGHFLSHLYDDLPDTIRKQLADLFQKIQENYSYELVAFINLESPQLSASPENRDIRTVKGFFEYFDQDIMWWEKRYIYEFIDKKRWRHYLTDIHIPTELISQVMQDIPPYPKILN